MPRLSLAQRLLLFWFAATIAVLVVAGGIYSALRQHALAKESAQQLNQAMQRLDAVLTHRSDELAMIGDTLADTAKLQATLNLFHGYFALTKGNPDIFDAPAEDLAVMLGESGRTAGVDWIVVTGTHGPIAGYANGRTLYWSQRSGEGAQLFASTGTLSPFAAVADLPGLIRPTTHGLPAHFAPCRTLPGLAIVRDLPIRGSNGDTGHLSLGRCLDQKLVDRVAAEAGIPFALEAGGVLLQSPGMPTVDTLPPASQALGVTGALHWFPPPRHGLQDDTAYATAQSILADGQAVSFAFARNLSAGGSQAIPLLGAGFLALAAVSLLVMAGGLIFLRRQVTAPLSQLMGAVDSARAGHFQPLTGALPDNELGSLAALLNETMAELLRQQTHLHTLVATMPDLIWLKDKEGVYLACNPRFEEFFGASEAEIVGKTDYDFVDAELADSFRHHDQAAMAAGGPSSNEEWLRFARGGYRGLFSTTKTPMCLPDGTLIGVLGVAHDITPLRRALDELAGHRDRLEEKVGERTAQLEKTHRQLLETQFAMDSVGIGIHWVDPVDGRLTYVNRHAAEMLGYTPEEMLALRVPDIDAEVGPERLAEIVAQARRDGSRQFESVQKARDGRRIPVEISLYHRPGCAEQPERLITFISDISRRKEAEQALQQAKAAAEAANQSKSRFLANMSHEIRTPLGAITGMAHLIRRAGLPPEQSERLNKIEVAGHHLLEVINAILDLSKIEAGKFELEVAEVNTASILANVASMLQDKAQDKGLQLRLDGEPQPVPLLGDPTRLQQALLNFAGNALKFTEHGSVTLRVRHEQEDDETLLVRFAVEDTGVGIDAATQGRLFAAFEQADNTISRRFGGSGLGLVISRRLAQAMGGDTGLHSQPGVGSTFWFTARLKKGTSARPTVPVASHGEAAETVLARDFVHCRLLLAEDEPVNREVALSLFEDVGIAVDSAEDGAQALAMARERDYDLILMDMQMPKMDGLEATRQIRAIGQRLPILAMTANAFAEDRARCLDAGMDDFITKPVDPERLFATVLKWLRRDSAAAVAAAAAQEDA
ncbi:MAG: hypothetical protein CVU18_11145 [Betaproteobacteria bacterium HGW-Betaproteobacteria-12]|nr:MAG: hypothetical protein CVU18_11145 [Betaproteobacteria bacterium HGW-Betaproteobacteria-12]